MNTRSPRSLGTTSGHSRRRFVALFLIVLLSWSDNRTRADALVVTQAMRASTIAEIFVEQDRIRVEFEIGAPDLSAFANCFPGQADEESQHDERLATFFSDDWVTRADGKVLVGTLRSIVRSRRVVRDDVTGDPLPEQPPDAAPVLRVAFDYSLEERPATIRFRPLIRDGVPQASIGFVCYHAGLPVNDFRYLSDEATLDLDWSDPWYSRFRHPNLRRQFDAPLSAYLYVEPYEVRKEIIVRPVDLEEFIDLDLTDDGVIRVEQQKQIKDQITDFLSQRNPLRIDGQDVEGRLDRVHFIHRTLRTTGIIEPPVDLPTVSATLGVIFVYPIEALPQQVSMTCDLFTSKIRSIPAVASDEAGGLPATVTAEDPVLIWKNYLKHPESASFATLPAPSARPSLSFPTVAVACALLGFAIFLLVRQMIDGRMRRPVAFALGALVLLAVTAASQVSIPLPFAEPPALEQQQASELIGKLLFNVYRSFDHHDESSVYDRLARSVDGELLADVYLETRKTMELRNQGGLRISVKEVSVVELAAANEHTDGTTYQCDWVVRGRIGHWGHVHARENEHSALITVSDRDGRWKITAMEMLNKSAGDA